MNSFDKIVARTPKETDRFVSKMLDIAERIQAILVAKNMKQSDLAKLMGKSESEISKWLTGLHNLEMKTITKIETVLGEEIFVVYKPQKIVKLSKKTFLAVQNTQNIGNWAFGKEHFGKMSSNVTLVKVNYEVKSDYKRK